MHCCSPTAAFGLDTPFDEQPLLVTSPLFSPLVLALVRLLVAIYTTTVLVFGLVDSATRSNDASTYLTYFTRLSYIGICAYFWAATTQTLSFALRQRQRKSGYALQSWPKILQFLHLYLTSSILTLPIIVTVVYWVLLTPSNLDDPINTFLTISQHALNAVFILFEMLLTNVPPPRWGYLGPCVLILALYLAMAYVVHAAQGYYTYPFLNPVEQGPLLAAYVVGIGLAGVIVFILVHWIMRLRVRLTPPSTPAYSEEMSEKRAREERIDEWEEIRQPTPV